MKTAKKNKQLLALYDDINAWKAIVSEKSKEDGSEWGSYINDSDEAVVIYAKSENKACALAHELLHFSIQKSGYRRILSCVSTLKPGSLMKRLISCLDNELQHHRMFTKFCELGYTRTTFYNDEDCQTAAYLENVLTKKNDNLLELLPDYMTLISPGGSLTKSQKATFSSKFRALTTNPVFFDAIDVAIEKWTNMESLDQTEIVSSIISAIPGEHLTWIGFDDGTDFPDSGFFVGKPFTIEEVIQRNSC